MKISAHNVLKGTVKNITLGAVSAEVVIELPGGTQMVSVITKSSVEAMGLKVGSKASAVVKATSVMVMVD